LVAVPCANDRPQASAAAVAIKTFFIRNSIEIERICPIPILLV
jgi:hypothetical protein